VIIKKTYGNRIGKRDSWQVHEDPVIWMRGRDHSFQVVEIHRAGTYRVRSWRGRIISLREMSDYGNEGGLLKVVGVERRGGSGDFAQKFHAGCRRR